VKSDFSSDLANFTYESKPSDANPVYSSVISGGQLVVTVTKADPDYKTWAFSFGKDKAGKNQAIDIRAYPVVKFDVNFTKTGTYNANEVLIEAQLEDANGKILNMDALGNLQRVYVALNTTKTVEFNFKNGMRGAASTAPCGNKFPCNEKEFDFSKVVRVNMWVNPQAGGTAKWIRPVFSGTMKVDNFSIGYNSAAANSPECTAIRDDDGDGVKQETDKCQGTPEGTPVDDTGCAIITGMSSTVNGSLNIYPVPASDRIHVDQQVFEYTEAVIMDLTGNTVQEIRLNNTVEEITLGHLPKGVYMIRLSGSGKSEFLKVVLQ
jgi:hypothetical protein